LRDEEIKDSQRATWASLSHSWEEWDEAIMAQLGPISVEMISHLNVANGRDHLDIASGTGEPGISIARLMPEGQVVLTDISREMLEVAVRRASAQGVTNVATQVCSADELPFRDFSFDSVSIRLGYMFFPDPSKATTELIRVLKPGGRICASVWAGPDDNPWITLPMSAIASEVELAPLDPDSPNMFRCSAPGYVVTLFETVELTEVVEWDVHVELAMSSSEECWRFMSEHMSLVSTALKRVDPRTRQRIANRVKDDVANFEKGGSIRIPGLARCTVGTRT
jgi:SAM-dependent methyltransferase